MSEAANSLEQRQTVEQVFGKFSHFAKVLLDAYAVVDKNGKVVKANQLFAQLTGIKMRQILKTESINELLEFSVNDDVIGIENLLEYESPIRIDEVRGKTNSGAEPKNLILGLYPFFNDEKSEKLGAFLIMRDVTAETNLQDQYKDKAIQSITDPLTGLFTRGYFEEYLTGQVTRMENKAAKDRYPISIVMCDIDFFKKVNDQYGHQAGDYVLKVVAELMRKTFRKTDVCCRYGGEEFLVILPAANFENAGHAANKLRHAVQKAQIVFEETHIPVTISCGVSTINIGQESYEETMARSDAALYEAKRSGRNLVCLHDGDQIIPTDRD
ncbi:sensor domain-containing diguanylate cyclase [Pseudobacteriovorax antillogorgiicola]|uniref:diguanylate cyclase n=2 Tax=Pseudobacteriovorax antillogorgiicola TaxID=1513793 RepID=A0A1Y6B8I4_9BACT|nr:sensor domain-containing diguanylate cyclase [Pseudobacteriovorax antillogorgiicola]TCS58597.1 PAS domain S-box-containing protein/diguanylate cyclase (GGDEF)-like protein [Pseudobacteriovorax antillogorgiicola]SME97045.1 PAS domain S-box-containing protein/diguanylate cyclase (GGDEF) domain-containing protein [Pseudobacteriovorax antillogorgiicola]